MRWKMLDQSSDKTDKAPAFMEGMVYIQEKRRKGKGGKGRRKEERKGKGRKGEERGGKGRQVDK